MATLLMKNRARIIFEKPEEMKDYAQMLIECGVRKI